jgi:hypothetical protein
VARKARIIAPPQDLKRRAVNFRKGLDLSLSAQDIKRIETAIEKSKDRCSNEVSDQLASMRLQFPEAMGNRIKRPGFLRTVRAGSLDIKGLGGMFGFPLLTAFAKSLNDYVTSLKDADDTQMSVIATHIDALYVVLVQRIAGLGGKVEGDVLDGFKTATRKFK